MTPSKLDTFDVHSSEEGMEVHPVIALLIARMESHPHDFYKYAPNQSARGTVPNSGKMSQAVGQLLEHTKALWNRKEKRLYNLMLRKVRLEEAHMRMIRLLLDGAK